MKSKFLITIVAFTCIACSSKVEKYACEHGDLKSSFVKKSNSAILDEDVFKFCENKGNTEIYSDDCKKAKENKGSILVFDSVIKRLELSIGENYFQILHCEKVD